MHAIIAPTLALAFLLGICSTAHAQQVVSTTSRPWKRTPLPQREQLAWSAGYYGETLTHVGLSLGVERHLSTTIVTRRQPRPRLHWRWTRQNFLTAQLSGYHHPKSHLATMLTGGIGTRRITRRAVKFEGLTSLGYMHLFRYGTTYRVQDDGTLDEVWLAQSPKIAVQFAFGFGQDFNFRPINPKPIAWHIRPGLLLEVPHNTLFLPRFTLEAGVTYRFGGKG